MKNPKRCEVMNETSTPPERRSRKLISRSLWTVSWLALLTVGGVSFYQAHQQKLAVAGIVALGGNVWYRGDRVSYNDDSLVRGGEQHSSPNLMKRLEQKLFGRDFVEPVDWVTFDKRDFTDAELVQLERHLRNLKGLNYVDLSRTSVSDTSVKKLRDALPTCSIRR